ncbi:MAG: hypothetical protein ACTSV7_13480 [Candidatus Baldrarchaeia archaeon]
MADCPLCRLYQKREIITKLHYEDDTCIIVNCKSHPNKILIVLKRHTKVPTPEEAEHMYRIAHKLFPGKLWRYPQSIKDHFHLHEV